MAYDLFNTVLSEFNTALVSMRPAMLAYGTTAMVAVAAGGGALVVAKAGIAGTGTGSWSTMMFELMFGWFKIALVYMIMSHVFEWGQAVVDIGTRMAEATSGHSPYSMTPSGIYGLGQELGNVIMTSRAGGLWLIPSWDSIISRVLTDVVIPITFFAAALMEFSVMVEAILIITVGPLVLCFAAIELAFQMLIHWFWHLIALALKTMAIVLIITVFAILIREWTEYIAGSGMAINPNPIPYNAFILTACLLVPYCLWVWPNRIASTVGLRGNLAISLGESFMGAAAGAVGGAVAAAPQAAAGAVRTAESIGEVLWE